MPSLFTRICLSGAISEYLARTERKPLLLYLIESGFIDSNSLFVLETSNHSISAANNVKVELEKHITRIMQQMSNICFMKFLILKEI